MKVIITNNGIEQRVIADNWTGYYKRVSGSSVQVVSERSDSEYGGELLCSIPFKQVPEYDADGNENPPDPSLNRAHEVANKVCEKLDSYLSNKESYYALDLPYWTKWAIADVEREWKEAEAK